MKRSFSEINDFTDGDFFKGGENEWVVFLKVSSHFDAP